MNIDFKNPKTAKLFNSGKALVRKFGRRMADKIMTRLSVMYGASNLSQIPNDPPDRCHPLTGDLRGEYAVDLIHPYRLIFEPDHVPIPRLPDGGVDEVRVTCIKINGVEDYH